MCVFTEQYNVWPHLYNQQYATKYQGCKTWGSTAECVAFLKMHALCGVMQTKFTVSLFQMHHFGNNPHMDRKRGRASISPSSSTPSPPAYRSYKHKPPMETQKSPLMSSTICYLFLKYTHQSKLRRGEGGGREDIQHTQRKPAKGNGAPQSAYPVYAAFNRMLLMHRFLCL